MQSPTADLCRRANDVGKEEFSSRSAQETGVEMKAAGVAIDAWKLPIFKKHLDAAGRKYTEHPGLTKDTLLLMVEYEWVADIKPIIEAANLECAKI